jgi:transcriptional regulator with XRE-family HTH domain
VSILRHDPFGSAAVSGSWAWEVVAVTAPEAASFGSLLRRLRVAAGLTQEELAGAARVSVRSVSDLERGVNLTARRDTAKLLADALKLAGPARAAFESAARGRAPDVRGLAWLGLGAGVAAARTLPRDVSSFVGRDRELQVVAAAASTAAGGAVVGICAAAA